MFFWHLTPLLWSLEHVNKMTNSKWTWSASKWVLIEIFEWGTSCTSFVCSLARRIHFLRVCPVCSMCSSPCINILFSIKISYLSTDKLGANWVSVLSLPPWLRIAYVGVSPSLPSASIHVRIQQKKKALLQKPFHNTLNWNHGNTTCSILSPSQRAQLLVFSNNWFNISALQHISPKNREHCQACYSSNQHIHTYSVSIISNWDF